MYSIVPIIYLYCQNILRKHKIGGCLSKFASTAFALHTAPLTSAHLKKLVSGIQKNHAIIEANKKSIAPFLFNAVTAGAIEALFDENNKPLFKQVDIGQYPVSVNNRHNYKNFGQHFVTRVGIEMGRVMGGFSTLFLRRDIIGLIYSLTWLVR